MRYGSTLDATDWTPAPTPLGVRVISALLFFIPRANPDLQGLYPRIKRWVLEVDDEGYANREIAVDAEDEPIFRTPDDRNLGFWPDTDRKFAEADLDPISQDEFERLWLAAEGWMNRTKTAEPGATDNPDDAQRI